MQEKFYKVFTEDHANFLKAMYTYEGFNYPTAWNRKRILSNILTKYDLAGKKALDIGCGGGDVSFLLAERGAEVTGFDASPDMVKEAQKRAEEKGIDHVRFFNQGLEDLGSEIRDQKYDLIVAFGLIGYLDDDRVLFDAVTPMIKDNGLFLFSCRNRLFNLTSISPNTEKEIRSGEAISLIEEMNDYYREPISKGKTKEFIALLRGACDAMEEALEKYDNWEAPQKNFNEAGAVQPRQTTPKQAEEMADEYGYDLIHRYGVHPHLLLPRSNKLFPPEIFNRLSDSLIAMEDQPISMIWSSVFICECVKRGQN